MRNTSRKKIALLIVLILSLVVPPIIFPKRYQLPTVTAAEVVTEGFEDWNTNSWLNETGNGGSVSISTDEPYTGVYSLKGMSDGSDWNAYGRIWKDFTAMQTMYLSEYINASTLPENWETLTFVSCSHDDPYTTLAALRWKTNTTDTYWGLLTKTLAGSSVTYNATPNIVVNTDYKITMGFYGSNAGNGWVSLKVDDVLVLNVTSLYNNATASGDYIVRIQVGMVNYETKSTQTVFIDNLMVDDATEPTYSPAPTYSYVWYNTSRAGDGVAVASFWTGTLDTIGYGWIQHNSTGLNQNTTAVAIGGFSGNATSSFTLNSTVGNVVRITSYANATTGGEETASGTFDITTTSSVTESRLLVTYPNSIIRSNATDATVILRGTNIKDWAGNAPNSTFGIIGTGSNGLNVWNVTNMRSHLDAMRIWNLTTVRVHICAEYFLDDPWSDYYIDHLQTLATEMDSRGMYLILDLYSINHTSDQVSLPYYPHNYEKDRPILNTSQDFTNFWVDVAKNFTTYPNVMFDLYNEPQTAWVGSSASDVGVPETTAFEIRKYCDNPIVIQQGMATIPDVGFRFSDWDKSVLFNCSYNTILSTHLYRDGDDERFIPDPISALEDNYTTCGLDNYATYFPVIIGEIGCNMDAANVTREHVWITNTVILFEEDNKSWLFWHWATYGSYWVFNETQASTEWGWIPETSTGGIYWMANARDRPGVWTVGNGTLNGYNYLYNNNSIWSESWNGTHLNITISSGSGDFSSRVFWNESNSYPINSSLSITLSNGSSYDALDYYDADKCLIIFNYTTASDVWMLYGYGADVGWTGIIMGVTNPNKIMGISVTSISKVNEIS